MPARLITAEAPPEDAVILFDGTDLSGWTKRDGSPPEWKVEDGILQVVPRTGDIISCEKFKDFYLHIEFRCPEMPDAKGQARGNSGVYLQGCYEIQVLDSSIYDVVGRGDCGAFYNQHAPLVNASLPPMQWQTYDVIFRSARLDDDGNVVEKARATVFHNGVLIHNNVELAGPTDPNAPGEEGKPGPILLQDHGNLVAYRNIWAVRLPEEGSKEYQPGVK